MGRVPHLIHEQAHVRPKSHAVQLWPGTCVRHEMLSAQGVADRHDAYTLSVSHPQVPVAVSPQHVQRFARTQNPHGSRLMRGDGLRPDNKHRYRGLLYHLLRHAAENRMLQPGQAACADCDYVDLKLPPESHD